MKKEALINICRRGEEQRRAIPSCTAWPEPRRLRNARANRNDFPEDGKHEGPSRTRCIQGCRGCWHRLPGHGTAPKQSHAKSTPRSPGGTREGTREGLQATSYSLRAGNSASFYQTPHQSFYISLPSAGSAQTLRPLLGSRTPCASCSAPVTCGGDTGSGGTRAGGKSNKKRNKTEKNIIMKVFQARAGTYAVSLEQDIQILAAFAVFILHQGALVYGVVAVGLWAVTAVKTFLS